MLSMIQWVLGVAIMLQSSNSYAMSQSVYEIIGFRSNDQVDHVEMTCDCSPPFVGTIVDIYRLNGQQQVKVGYVKVKERSQAGFIARVLQNGTTESDFLLEDYPQMMAGDLGVARSVRISRVLQLTPTQELSYYDLFEDPQEFPKSFRLTSHGKDLLKKAVKPYLESQISNLYIEGYTDELGDADENIVESRQRALMVRQYLLNEFHFEPNRIIAIGMGESEIKKNQFLPGARRVSRRIVLRGR